MYIYSLGCFIDAGVIVELIKYFISLQVRFYVRRNHKGLPLNGQVVFIINDSLCGLIFQLHHGFKRG